MITKLRSPDRMLEHKMKKRSHCMVRTLFAYAEQHNTCPLCLNTVLYEEFSIYQEIY